MPVTICKNPKNDGTGRALSSRRENGKGFGVPQFRFRAETKLFQGYRKPNRMGLESRGAQVSVGM